MEKLSKKIEKAIVFCLFFFCGCNTCATTSTVFQREQGVETIERILLKEINRQRHCYGLASLKMQKDLQVLARRYSMDMNHRNFFDHIDPNKRNIGERLAGAGITFSIAAENLALVSEEELNYGELIEAWLDSKHHKKNLLDAKYTKTGIGIFKSTQNRFYITHIFLKP